MTMRQKWFTIPAITLVVAGSAYLISERISVSAVRIAPIAQNVQSAVSRSDTGEFEVKEVSQIEINDIQISLPVVDGEYDASSNSWTLDESHAFFMKGTATPLIYGHAKPAVFGPLSDVKQGTVLKLQTSEGVMAFRYVSDEFVKPDSTEILMHKIPNTVLLMTCDGWFSEQRRVLHFEYVPENDYS